MNPKLGEDTTNDNLRLGQILIIYHLLKTFKLIIIIANCTYFLAMAWLILIKQEDYINNENQNNYGYFVSEYKLDTMPTFK